ncbi:MAG TPA: hypothetical protein PLA50_20350 [Bacteroidia bacterium]|nr:hypothetical protein [Bacteroidia bacterium]
MASPSLQRFLLLPAVGLALSAAPTLRGQTGSDAPVIRDAGSATVPSSAAPTLPLRLDLSRRDLTNFLTDAEALAPYRTEAGEILGLRDIFMIGSVNAPYAVFWDPETCRLIGILNIDAPGETPAASTGDASSPPAPSPYLLKATGPMPLAKTPGASGASRYFGFRLVKGVPEFLYQCGTLAVEERLWLDDGGRVLRQRFSVKGAPASLQITVPSAWEKRVSASVGQWKGALLTVPKESAGEVILTYPLVETAPESQPSAPN